MLALALYFTLTDVRHSSFCALGRLSTASESRTADPTGQAKKLALTNQQMVIVCTSAWLAFFMIVGEGALT
jgi:hypothetical protein